MKAYAWESESNLHTYNTNNTLDNVTIYFGIVLVIDPKKKGWVSRRTGQCIGYIRELPKAFDKV